jgi:hypothetical protein
MNTTTETKMNFVLFAGHTGHTFFPFQAASWEEADKVAEAKGWVVDDHQVGTADEKMIVVIPRSMARLATVHPIR